VVTCVTNNQGRPHKAGVKSCRFPSRRVNFSICSTRHYAHFIGSRVRPPISKLVQWKPAQRQTRACHTSCDVQQPSSLGRLPRSRRLPCRRCILLLFFDVRIFAWCTAFEVLRPCQLDAGISQRPNGKSQLYELHVRHTLTLYIAAELRLKVQPRKLNEPRLCQRHMGQYAQVPEV
jgi:hypothetical protein